ncbi:YIP1 family protein [Sphingobacterium sp. xlx-130]|uniref:YIP1 family protein n=1 Tax=Sphingobacterium sp. xlx-130 TaxID=2654323 RepID=UPI0013DABEA2|nr:YIP1 family protein [Sphingobacterium sp. xlx-130]
MQQQIEEKGTLRFIISNIWTKPRWFFNYITDQRFEKYMWILFYFGVLAGNLSRFREIEVDNITPMSIFIKVFLVNAILTIIFYQLFAFILSLTGKWISGSAQSKDIFRIMCYAIIPGIGLLVLHIVGVSLFGPSYFTKAFWAVSTDQGINTFKMVYQVVQSILAINVVFFFIIGIAVTQKFSIWKAILNIALPVLIFSAIVAAFYLKGSV